MAALRGGYIPGRWRDMRVVLIPNPGRDLTQTKNWRPLNLNNCIGKLGEKVVADRIQEEGSSILHHQQYGSVCGRSAVDILYKSVVRARRSLEGGGSVGWVFWDVVAELAICTLISSFLFSHIYRCFGLCNSLGGHICGDSYEG